jgi:2'-5' RNA ligase
MIKRYSIAIYPSQYVIDFVKVLKDLLKNKVKDNWYPSCNSIAHITIIEFDLDDSQLEKLKQKLVEVCNTFVPFQVYLNDFGIYENNLSTFFIKPTEDSATNFDVVMKKTQDILKFLKPFNIKKSNNPHISIGRKLTPENIKIALATFTKIDIDFLCDTIVLRELEPHKQFFVIETFTFGSNPQPELIQGSLF